MKLKNIKPTISAMMRLSLPSSPLIRTQIFRILSELEQEQQIIEKLETSYKNAEFAENERQKYEFVKTFEAQDGVPIFDLKISTTHISEVVAGINRYNNQTSYKLYELFLEYIETQYFLKSELLNIDDLRDDTFDGLTSEEIELLMGIIK